MTGPIAALASDGLMDDLSRAQLRRRLVMAFTAALATVVLLFVGSSWRFQSPHAYRLIELTGLILILLAIAGRTWCAAYIGGRKKVELVQTGPYALVRHPLYLFSIIGAAGIGALWGSIVVSFMLAAATAIILKSVTRQEEQFLAAKFGKEYTAYAARVDRYFPRQFSWSTIDAAAVDQKVTLRTFVQSSFFLVGVPLAAFVQWAQAAGVLPILINLP